MERIDLAIIAATPSELSPLATLLPVSATCQIAGNSFRIGNYGNISVLFGTTGIGKVNAAAIASALLSRFKVLEIWNIGCAGAYGASGLIVGDVLAATTCICGDEGILNRDSMRSMRDIGIPFLWKNGIPLYDSIPLDDIHARRQIRSLLPPGPHWIGSSGFLNTGFKGTESASCFSVYYGPSLTVGMVSGDIETANERFLHHGAMAENMEGSAIALVCALFDVPFLELRGISNIAGIRDKDAWDINSAVNHVVAVIRYLLDKVFRSV